ncbi:MAG: VWA domain-containing protein [Gammaproteobacteria bacterium]|nr:VWA domain-containing protein [Gammaproteobacteria bacterium]
MFSLNKNILVTIFVATQLVIAVMVTAAPKVPEFITSALQVSKIIPNAVILDETTYKLQNRDVYIQVKKIITGNTKIYIKEIWLFSANSRTQLSHQKLTSRQNTMRIRVQYNGDDIVYVVALLSNGQYVSGSTQLKHITAPAEVQAVQKQEQNNPSKVVVTRESKPMPRSARKIPSEKLKSQFSANVGSGSPTVGYDRFASAFQQHIAMEDSEQYATPDNNGVKITVNNPLSTFSVDVDTGSYSNVRRFILSQGRIPPKGAVRVEEMINYFNYDYTPPESKDVPFAIHTEAGPAPWNKQTRLLRIGLKGYETETKNLPPSNLVFLLDVSGSMGAENKLPLLIRSLKLLSSQLRKQDKVAIVVYAGASGVVLPVTSGDQHATIARALDQLHAGGSTNGGEGIQLAYALAREGFIKGGINRVILATDGDFNVGVTNHDDLINLIKKQRDSGINLTTLGFGFGNYNDKLIEQLANHGNGNHAYIDTFSEARKVLLEQMSGTLLTIAKDVKIQVEFNPAVVAEYRLIGYENRLLRDEDFRNDKVDAGDIGAGHTVTALYELTMTDSEFRYVPKLKYTDKQTVSKNSNEIATIKLRFKQPDGATSRKVERVVNKEAIKTSLTETSADFRFAAAVAGFGQWLRQENMLKGYATAEIVKLAEGSRGKDKKGYRAEFIRMVETAGQLRKVN